MVRRETKDIVANTLSGRRMNNVDGYIFDTRVRRALDFLFTFSLDTNTHILVTSLLVTGGCSNQRELYELVIIKPITII